MNKIIEINSRQDLADLLNISLQKLTYILYAKHPDQYYQSFTIPKKTGGVRTIDASTGDLKSVQKKLAEHLSGAYSNNNISHAFKKGKSIITNAKSHRNKKFILTIDLNDFFHQFHFGRVRGFFAKNRNFKMPISLATIIAQLTCYKGCLPQGTPSSPVITNLICEILDTHICSIAKKYRVNYTRYADDMTFSTNDPQFQNNSDKFLQEIEKELNRSGFSINKKKTRLTYRTNRQSVTGLIVNKKINVNRTFYKNTRAMADSLYRTGVFTIDGVNGTIKQLEGRFAFINQLEFLNSKKSGIKHTCKIHSKGLAIPLSARERQYQKFLFYKYFWYYDKPLIITEGKTDKRYIKAALMANYKKFPDLIQKTETGFQFKISFLHRSKRLSFFFGLTVDGGCSMRELFRCYTGEFDTLNLYEQFREISNIPPANPVIMLYDNEQENKDRPLKQLISNNDTGKYLKLNNKKLDNPLYRNIKGNLFVLTIPLNEKHEAEIEDLFLDQTLNHKINNKPFSREDKVDRKAAYDKNQFSEYILSNYRNIDFSKFIPLLHDIEKIIEEYNQIRNSKTK